MIIEISVAIAVLAFVVLVYFLIRTLIDLRKTLHQVNNTLLFTESRIDPIQEEALELLKNTKNITATLNEQLTAVNPLVETVHDVGTAFQEATYEFSHGIPHRKLSRTAKKSWSETLSHILEFGSHALNAWNQSKRRSR
jgi:uncharacterized protein YoxC